MLGIPDHDRFGSTGWTGDTTIRTSRMRLLGAAWCLAMGLCFGWFSGAEAEQRAPSGRLVVDASVPSYTARAGISGGIAIAGSDTMQPVIARIASVFKQWQPNVKIAVQGGGTDVAMRAFVQGISASRRGDGNVKGHLSANDVEILASSRSLTVEERKDFQSRHGYEPTEIPIALDAVAIYVNHENPVQGLTMEQVDAIFSKTRKRGLSENISSWGQVGSDERWAQQPIRLYGRDRRSGTRTFFIHEALLDGELKSEVKEEPGPALEILDISRDALGIGYAGIGFQASTVRVLPIAERAGMPFVNPSAESAASGSYPLARFLFLYVNKAPDSELDQELLEFLRFINSQEGQGAVVKAGYYPLPPAQVTKNLQTLVGAPISASAVMTRSR